MERNTANGCCAVSHGFNSYEDALHLFQDASTTLSSKCCLDAEVHLRLQLFGAFSDLSSGGANLILHTFSCHELQKNFSSQSTPDIHHSLIVLTAVNPINVGEN